MQTYLKCTYQSAKLTPNFSCFLFHLSLQVKRQDPSNKDKEGCTSRTQSVVMPFSITWNAIQSLSRWLKIGDVLC